MKKSCVIIIFSYHTQKFSYQEMNIVKIRQIEYFLEVEKTLNITKAARNMYVSQTAVTKQLQLLEEELGFALFLRENKRMQLTEGGAFFKQEALRLMHQYHLTEQNISAYRYGESGCINIGFVKNLDTELLISYLSLFRSKYPEIEVNPYGYSNLALHQHIQNGTLDVGFGISMNNSRFHYRSLKSYPLVLLTSKSGPLAGINEISEQELENVLFDVRNYPTNSPLEFEGMLIKIACGYGNAIVHQFAKKNRFQDYLVSIPLIPCQMKTISLIYDDHYCRTKDLFIETCL
ncbi:LysR family transcriptional regulator [bacterium C-53]|nr:LysR family transcriptional regulator [Lachnospiraceae bacterium]NBI02296.1 LysR family transcriptional regulator [Lachnospiraceae bacterium]RKJ11860.1 LysR family transcriptional regulator [bacterium C-53]